MRKILIIAACAALMPMAANAATLVVQGGGPEPGGAYSVQSDTLFFGSVSSEGGGAGSFTIDFVNPSGSVTAIAFAAVTGNAVSTLFTDLTFSWLDGVTLNTLVQAAGVDTLTTVFSGEFQSQSLVFKWSDSIAGTTFGFDVETSQVPIPAALPLFISALFGLGFATRRRRDAL